MSDDKYIVFKRSDFYELMGELALPPWEHSNGEMCGDDVDCAPIAEKIKKRSEETSIDDAVVIRRKDVFAPPALDAYANSIMIALSLDPESTHSDWGQDLQEIADYFHQQAALSWVTNRKIPD